MFINTWRLYRAFNKYLGTISELKQKPVDQVPADEGIIIPAAKSNVINPRKLITFAIISYRFNGVSSFTEYDHIQLSDLQIVGTLGVGGFGRVELVQYEKKETFALKILKKYEVASQGQIEHAYSEKDIMASCDSTFIVKCVVALNFTLFLLKILLNFQSDSIADYTKLIETKNICTSWWRLVLAAMSGRNCKRRNFSMKKHRNSWVAAWLRHSNIYTHEASSIAI